MLELSKAAAALKLLVMPVQGKYIKFAADAGPVVKAQIEAGKSGGTGGLSCFEHTEKFSINGTSQDRYERQRRHRDGVSIFWFSFTFTIKLSFSIWY